MTKIKAMEFPSSSEEDPKHFYFSKKTGSFVLASMV